MSSELSTESTEKINEFITTAKRAGVERDQLLNFLNHGYVPFPWQMRFHAIAREADKPNGPVDIGVGGARGPGKSHATFAQITLDDCTRCDGLKVLFLRQTGKSAQESFQDLIDSVLVGRVDYEYNTSRGLLRFKNRSKVMLGGFEDENDIDKYVGIQYDVIVVEERNQLSGEKIMKLKGSLRTTKTNWRARMYSSFNPGNIGHADIKKEFVDPFYAQTETRTRFIPATYKDNPFLKEEYIDYLKSLKGALGKAWREGNFDSFEGQYFTEWSNEQHVIKPFLIDPSWGWKRFRAYDHGRTNAACCKWYAVDYDGNVYVYRELYQTGWNVDQLAQRIAELSVGEEYSFSVADPAIFANQGMVDRFGGQTIAETFKRYGVTWLPASNRRIDGWNLMHQYLDWNEKKKPQLRYFSTCYDSIKTIPNLIHDDHKPEDLDTKGEDHAADVDRYFLVTLHERKSNKPLTNAEKTLERIKKSKGLDVVQPSVLNDFYSGKFYRNSMK